MQVATQTISRIPRNFYVGISHCRPSLVGRATSPKVPLSRGVTTSVRALARLPAVPVSHSFYVEELLPSFDDVGPLFGRDVAEQLGAPVEDGRAAEDLFFEQPILDDSEIPHRELDGEYTRHVYFDRRAAPVASPFSGAADLSDLFDEANPPEPTVFVSKRTAVDERLSLKPEELEGLDMEANPPEIYTEFKRNLTKNARPLLEKLSLSNKGH